jgi:hypothetical protein
LSEKTASQAGSRLAKDPDVIAYMTRQGYNPEAAGQTGQGDKKAKRLNVVKGEPEPEKPKAPTPEERAAMWAALGVERVTQPDPDKANAPAGPGDARADNGSNAGANGAYRTRRSRASARRRPIQSGTRNRRRHSNVSPLLAGTSRSNP